MESSLIVDVWNTFKDSIDKKQIDIVAESFVDSGIAERLNALLENLENR